MDLCAHQCWHSFTDVPLVGTCCHQVLGCRLSPMSDGSLWKVCLGEEVPPLDDRALRGNKYVEEHQGTWGGVRLFEMSSTKREFIIGRTLCALSPWLNVVTQKTAGNGNKCNRYWGHGPPVTTSLSQLPLQNRFDALQEEMTMTKVLPGFSRSIPCIKNSSEKHKIWVTVTGDSLLKRVEGLICRPDPLREVYCLPGAWVSDVRRKLPSLV